MSFSYIKDDVSSKQTGKQASKYRIAGKFGGKNLAGESLANRLFQAFGKNTRGNFNTRKNIDSRDVATYGNMSRDDTRYRWALDPINRSDNMLLIITNLDSFSLANYR